MKKRIFCFILLIIFSISWVNISAEDLTSEEFTAAICVNYDTAVINGNTATIQKPLIVFEEVYVNLYDFALPLGLLPNWIAEGAYGYLSVTQPHSAKSADFTFIRTYDELPSSGKLFSKDGVTYIAIKDLSQFTNTAPVYENGIITFGCTAEDVLPLFPQPDLSASDNYIYTTYPKVAEYVVNPYVPYSHSTMMEDATKLVKLYPELITLSSIGSSVEGRDLLLIQFGKGDKKIFICGAHHAREYISTAYIMYAIDRYSYAYRNNLPWGQFNLKEILDNVTFCIVPMVNPDGVNIVQNGFAASPNYENLVKMPILDAPKNGHRAWKANANGVDVNWNYDKDWFESSNRSKVPASMGFNGTTPNTEPETQAVSAYVDSIPFQAFLSFHTQGQLIYFADDITNPTNLHNDLKADTGFSIQYENAEGKGGSFFDYVYRKYGKVTITVELCPYIGPRPYPDSDFDTVWNSAKNVILIVANKIINHASINS